MARLKAAADEWQDTYPSGSQAAQDAAGAMYSAIYALLAAVAPREGVRAA
jgi:hypothetical protein